MKLNIFMMFVTVGIRHASNRFRGNMSLNTYCCWTKNGEKTFTKKASL